MKSEDADAKDTLHQLALTDPFTRLVFQEQLKNSVVAHSQVTSTLGPLTLTSTRNSHVDIAIAYQSREPEVSGLLRSNCWLPMRVTHALTGEQTHTDGSRPARVR